MLYRVNPKFDSMKFMLVLIVPLLSGLVGCHNIPADASAEIADDGYADVQVVGAMRNVMWKGELGGSIALDTLTDKTNLYGLGPQSYLTGELLIHNGTSYLSKVTSDSTMSVEQTYEVSAPFFVYAYVHEWRAVDLPPDVVSIAQLEAFIDDNTHQLKRPFAFKLSGSAASADIHIQNLAEGTKVSSPEEAHQGQTSYKVTHEEVEIIGFFSTEHQGVFTHHDSFVHMHLITADESKMGHLDKLEINQMKLYLPVK